jgi:hypothetical protein
LRDLPGRGIGGKGFFAPAASAQNDRKSGACFPILSAAKNTCHKWPFDFSYAALSCKDGRSSCRDRRPHHCSERDTRTERNEKAECGRR